MKAVTFAAVCAVLAICVGQLTFAQWPFGADMPKPSDKSQPGVGITATGRFQVFVTPEAKGHTFMLDTDSGRVWIMKKDHSTGDFSFKRLPVDEVDAKKP